MATEPPSPLRLEAPGPPEMRTPPASEATPEGTPQPAGSRLRFLNGCVPLSHQVAGHMYGKDKVGILQHPDGTVLKQLQPPPRGPRELEFYNMVIFKTKIFCFSGKILEPGFSLITDLYLKLEDVTHKFNKPCIMDVKIGRKSYDPFASSEKIQQQVSKYPLMEEIGFLVLGMRVRMIIKNNIFWGPVRFFHNGFSLRKDAIAASIQKIKKILQWFESQEQLNFYASSLLFVYEGSSQPTTTKSNDRTLAEKFLSKGQLSDTEVLEYNNNFHVLSSTANGKIEASVGKSLSKMYARHRKMYSKKHHSQTSLKVENMEQDNGWKSMSQEHLNGNVLSQLEKVFYHLPTDCQEIAEVEVRMIDFAHVFPSNTIDEGYVYGLKHLITVLQSILDN
uniref:Kinase n=1 Tax=Propithecus coquereli TaxID=379532 RepID=A0A2K6ENQ2_PROCO